VVTEAITTSAATAAATTAATPTDTVEVIGATPTAVTYTVQL